MTFLTHPNHATLQKLVSGDLVPVEADAARAHLDDCSSCRRRASEISQLFAHLATPPALPEPPIDFLAAVMAKVEREAAAVPVLVSRGVAWRGLGAGAATALGGAALLVIGGGSLGIRSSLADAAISAASAAGHANLVLTIARAALPVAAAGAVASLAVITPLVWKAIQSIQPTPVRATARI